MSTDHYFSEHPDVASAPRDVALALPDMVVSLTTDAGVFSYGEVDPGTRILLRHAPAPPVSGPLLDLGCGYGPIAVVCARRSPDRTVWAVDVNSRARALTAANATRANAPGVRVAAPQEVPRDIRFAAIYSNPPIKVGKKVLHAMLTEWLARLAPGGSAYLVVHKHLGSDSLARWLTDQGFYCGRLASERGFRVLECHAEGDRR